MTNTKLIWMHSNNNKPFGNLPLSFLSPFTLHSLSFPISAAKEKKKAENSKRKQSFIGSVFSSKKPTQEEDEEDEHQDYEEVHSLQLTAKRLEAMRRENDQLFYSMSGAAIFFKRTDVDI